MIVSAKDVTYIEIIEASSCVYINVSICFTSKNIQDEFGRSIVSSEL